MTNDVNFEGDAPRGASSERQTVAKKSWHEPQLEKVSIAGLTEGMFNVGTDGAGQSSLS